MNTQTTLSRDQKINFILAARGIAKLSEFGKRWIKENTQQSTLFCLEIKIGTTSRKSIIMQEYMIYFCTEVWNE